jgi:hypothetical protein
VDNDGAASMTLSNSSIVSNGSPVATFLHADGKHYALSMLADDSGHIQQTLPTYSWWVPPGAVGANKLYGDIFNASGSGRLLEMRGLWAIPKADVAVTGVVSIEIGLYRTSAVGTGGTAHTYNSGSAFTQHTITPFDTGNSALPAQVTARIVPTGGATIAAPYWPSYIFTEETGVGTQLVQYENLLPTTISAQRITLREGQGLLIKQGTVAGVGSVGFLGVFTLT